jgi:hypothetical protein
MSAAKPFILAVALGGLTLALLAPAGAVATPDAASTTWTQVPSPNSPGSNELHGADAADLSQVWAVGRVVDFDQHQSPYRSLILRWDGSAWAPSPHPALAGNHALRGVAAVHARNVWAVGTRQTASGGLNTLVERWNGSRWSVVASPNGDPGGLNELAGVTDVPTAPRGIWAVGYSSQANGSYGTVGLILRRASGSWQVLPTPTFTPEDHLEAVDAVSTSSAWTVGWGSTSPFGGTAVGIALRWNGSSWASVPIPQPSPIMLFGVEAVSPNDVWAVGHTYLGGAHWIPLILHWDGSNWSRATIPVFPNGGQLRDVVALSPTNVYAVGLDGEGFNASSLVLRWNGSTWSREVTPSPPVGAKLFGAASISPSTVWGVGYRYDSGLGLNRTLTLRTTG